MAMGMQDHIQRNRHFGDSYSPACRRRSSSRTVPADLLQHRNPRILVLRRKTWVDRLFAGEESDANSPDKIVILQNGVEIEDVPIDPLGSWTVVDDIS